MQRSFVSVFAFAGKMLLHGLMRHVTGRDDMRYSNAVSLTNAPALRQMHFQKRAVAPRKATERTECLHHPCATRPSAARASAQRDHGHRARGKRILANPAVARLHPLPCVANFILANVLNQARVWKPILCKPKASCTQFALDSLMLNRIEAVLGQQRFERVSVRIASVVLRQ